MLYHCHVTISATLVRLRYMRNWTKLFLLCWETWVKFWMIKMLPTVLKILRVNWVVSRFPSLSLLTQRHGYTHTLRIRASICWSILDLTVCTVQSNHIGNVVYFISYNILDCILCSDKVLYIRWVCCKLVTHRDTKCNNEIQTIDRNRKDTVTKCMLTFMHTEYLFILAILKKFLYVGWTWANPCVTC